MTDAATAKATNKANLRDRKKLRDLLFEIDDKITAAAALAEAVGENPADTFGVLSLVRAIERRNGLAVARNAVALRNLREAVGG